MGLDLCNRLKRGIGVSARRIVMKLSGELFSLDQNSTVSAKSLSFLADSFREILSYGGSLALVVGGGNILRGREIQKECSFSRPSSDLIGMYATIINGLILRETLLQKGIPSVCFAPSNLIGSRFGGESASILSYDVPAVESHFSQGTVVILSGGTGNSFFTTDTATVLRALELNADLVVKATKVNGVYSADPTTTLDAKRYEKISFKEVIDQKIQVMDQSAFVLAEEHSLPLFIYKYGSPYSLAEAIQNSEYGTFVVPDCVI
ncbi:MAG: hypothetical protein QRY74_04425 [Chlamydia sp.]